METTGNRRVKQQLDFLHKLRDACRNEASFDAGLHARILRRMHIAQLSAVIALIAAASAASAQPETAAFFGFTLLNASPEPVSAEEEARVDYVEQRLVEKLTEAGLFAFVDVAPVAGDAARFANVAHCNGCDTEMAQQLGADVAITGEIQKTSNLILHMSIYVRDAETGEMVGGGSADLRGNTDETWRRTLDYIVRNRMTPR